MNLIKVNQEALSLGESVEESKAIIADQTVKKTEKVRGGLERQNQCLYQ